MTSRSALAIVPVRDGSLPSGADEATSEAGGRLLLIGSGTDEALQILRARTEHVVLCEAGDFAPANWAAVLARIDVVLETDSLILPSSPDGRDLAPRLAAELERPLLAGATEVRADRVVVVRQGGRVSEEYEPVGPFVTTLEPGSRGIEITSENGTASDADTGAGDNRNSGNGRNSGGGRNSDDAWDLHGTRVERIEPHVAQGLDAAHGDARVVEVLPPDPAAIDLAEAPRIMAGGAGLGDAYAFEVLRSVAAALGASMGATRVVTDAGFVAHERQIGTTGVSVSPRLYIALGISGAVQHTGGLGRPEHIVSVNLDPSCPMMTMADVAIVSDARGVLDALAERLGVREERFGTAEERLGVQEESLPKHDEGVHRGA